MSNGRRGDWPLWLVLGLLAVLHFYLRPRVYSGPGSPDFLLIALLIIAMRSRPGPAAVAGFVVGLLTDVLSPAHVGAGALAHTVVAYGAAWGRSVFFPDNLTVNAGMFALATLFRNLILLAATGSMGGALASALGWPSLVQALTTAVAGFLVMLLIRHRVDFRLET